MLHENDSRAGHPLWTDNDVYTGEPREQLPLTEPKMPIPEPDDEEAEHDRQLP